MRNRIEIGDIVIPLKDRTLVHFTGNPAMSIGLIFNESPRIVASIWYYKGRKMLILEGEKGLFDATDFELQIKKGREWPKDAHSI